MTTHNFKSNSIEYKHCFRKSGIHKGGYLKVKYCRFMCRNGCNGIKIAQQTAERLKIDIY